MKRLYLTFITALFLCAIAYAKDINVGGFHYRILNDKEVAVIGAEVNDTVLRIPSTVSIQNKQYTVVEKDQTAYLLPTDADGKSTEVCFPLARLYKELGELNAKSVIVFMDACFSGAQRGNGMLASARGVAIKAKEQKPMGKLIVLTAASGEETAYPYNEKGHGMFTYFLLKKLNESKGDCSLGELAEYIKTNVKRQSIVTNRKSQTPTTIFSDAVKDEWMGYKLIK